MRKGFLFGIIGLVVAGGICFYLFNPLTSPEQKQSVPLESVLPADTVGMVKLYDVTGQIERFTSERLGRSLAKMDIPAILRMMQMSPRERAAVIALKEKVKIAVNSVWFDTLFGREAACALRPVSPETTPGEEFNEDQITGTLIFVSRPKQPANVLESFSSMFNRQLHIQVQPYKEWKIKQFVLENDEPIYYALTDGILIAGFSPDVVRQCLDQSLDRSSSLLENESYKGHCADMVKPGHTETIFFADFHYFMNFMKDVVTATGATEARDPRMQIFHDQCAMMDGIEKISMVSYYDDGVPEENKVVISFDPDALSPLLKKSIGIAPQKNPMLEYAPADTLIYSWQNYFDLRFCWEEYMKTLAPGREDIDRINRYFSRNIGVELDQFLSAFGSQLVFLINDINTKGMFPFPELGILVEVTNPDVVEQAIQGLVRQTGMPLRKEAYKGEYISFIVSPMGMDLSPAYLCRDDVCFLAVNKRLLVSILDSPQNRGLSGQENFREIDRGISGENNKVCYINVEGLNRRIREALTWAESWMVAIRPDKGKRFRELSDLVLVPLLDGFSMYRAVGVRTYIEEERIVSEIYTLIDPSQENPVTEK